MQHPFRCAVVAIFIFGLVPRFSISADSKLQPQPDVGVWAEMLRSKNRNDRFKAVAALRDMGAKALPAVSILVDVLQKHADDEVRKYAAYALGAVGPKANRAVPALAEALQNEEKYDIAAAAAWALYQIGPKAKAAVPVLTAALQSRYTGIVCTSAQALGVIGADAKRAVPRLRFLLETASPNTRPFAAEALWQIEKNAVALAALAAHVQNRKLSGRSDAAAALGRIGPSAKSTVPALLVALNPDSGGATLLPVLAAESLWRIGKHQKAIPSLIGLLRDPSSTVRGHAAAALGRIGPDAKAAVPALKKALTDNVYYVAPFAREALRKIEIVK